MPVKHLVSPGIGFSPGSVKYVVTRGLTPGVAPVPTTDIDGNFADELRPFVDDDFMETARSRAEEAY